MDLYTTVFNELTDLTYWLWKYKENPVGSMRYVAEDGKKRIAGHYGLVFQRIKIGDKIVTGSQAVDAMTRRDFQRQGIFVELGKEILSRAGDAGIFLTFGFPNKAALPGHRKVGWVEICEVPVLLKPLNIESIMVKYIKSLTLLKISSVIARILLNLVRQRRRMQLERLSVKSTSRFSDQISEFWSRAACYYRIIQVRDREFLNWRFVRNPHRRYTILLAQRNATIVGYAILGEMIVHGIRGGAIVDILTYPDEEQISEFLISQAIERFKKKGVGYVGCMMRRGSKHFRALKKQGFIVTPERVKFILHVNSDKFSAPPDASDKWFLTWADTDFV